MIEKFPLSIADGELLVDDYFIFSTSFAEVLLRHIPTVQRIEFFDQEKDFFNFDELFITSPAFAGHFHALRDGQLSHVVCEGFIFLGFTARGGGAVVAVLAGADPLFLQKMSANWLTEKIDTALKEFHLLKQARVDTQTGLLNFANLHSLLDSCSSSDNLLLALVELPPRSTSFRHTIKYTHRCVALLKTFIRGRSILHYLGHNIFALVLQQGEEKTDTNFESSLVAYLKKAGCPRVHVGSSTSQSGAEVRRQEDGCAVFLDEAWTALHRASKRGPFNFCEYKYLILKENQPLSPPESAVVRKISRWCSGLQSFSLIFFSGDNKRSVATELLAPFVSEYKTIRTGADLFVLYPSAECGDVKKWVRDMLDRVSDTENDLHVSAGVLCYPFADIKKSEVPFACKKALLHARFFGPSSYAIFDHVSLNISGDVYFGDGDFTLAIKEYKRGLKCCGGDVNLYNSLGVTLAMMNRARQADESFQSGLALDQDNFMALYNMGLSKQSQNQKNEAVAYFSRALELRHAEDVDPHLIADLTLQLGILSCETGRYELSIEHIESWLTLVETETIGTGRVYYYLGLSQYQQGDNRSAIKSLERALRFDGFDDRALSLLGRLYLQEKEGTDIALSFCLKSVELDPDNIEYKLYLAETYLSLEHYDACSELLKQCLRRKATAPYAQLLMGERYLQEGYNTRAESWFTKVLKGSAIDNNVKKRAGLGLNACTSHQGKVKRRGMNEKR